MRAVILADEKGVELRPLTVYTPKPMVPLLNRPCMEYTIELLKRYGITDIFVMLRYFPDQVRDYFGDGSQYGVSLSYWEEPFSFSNLLEHLGRGTDSSVADTILVIPGAALIDCDLEEALHDHRESRRAATMVVAEKETSTEEQQVWLHQDGHIIQIGQGLDGLEEAWGTIDTGLLLLEPESISTLLSSEEEIHPQELARALFRNGIPLGGYRLEGYWSGLRTLDEYRQAQFDMLDGQVNVHIAARQLVPGIYVEGDLRIDASVRLEGPILFGKGVHLEPGVSIEAYSILGRQTVVSEGAWLSQAIVWEHSFIGMHAEVTGGIVGSHVSLGDCAVLGENSVIGERCRVGRTVAVKPGVMVWPHKEIEEGAVVHTSIVHGRMRNRGLFAKSNISGGIVGVANVDITPEYVTRLAAAYASQLPAGSRIVLSACVHPFAQLLKHSVMTSLCSAGIDTVDIGVGFAPLLRYSVQSLSCEGGIHLQMSESISEKQISIQFVGADGLSISPERERKIAYAFTQDSFLRALRHLGQLHLEHGVLKTYAQALLQELDQAAIRSAQTTLLIESESRFLLDFLHPIFSELGIVSVNRTISEGVRIHQADLGVRLEKSGESLELFTHTGERLTQEQLERLQKVVCNQVSSTDHARFHPRYDAIFSLFSILDVLARERVSLAALLHSIGEEKIGEQRSVVIEAQKEA
ncbi:sugar phosphate nucleotidyltransferase [Brevibacillus ruminantium]|uniref:Sugar phosphate nucleotidyltransferase n=1 Tax=Brevibacillus ruminantium TaxID=2950604 RepID=A0ABY4WKF5_9BACL|nr:sugar phosphate nucleotidyltransferase [Brevibacillus ruminantium]USG67602.1 sugar phosphate nucleotidyltransferase [Brevibacillus ruminantium]